MIHGLRRLRAGWLVMLVFLVAATPRRTAAIDATWNAGVVGNWSNPANWSSNPNIPNTAAYNVFISSGKPAINGTFSIGSLDWTGGALVGSGELTVNSDATLSGGDKKFAEATVNLNGNTTWTAGTIESVDGEGGIVNVGGAMDIQFDALWSWIATQTPTINVLAAGSITKSTSEGTAALWPEVNNAGMVHVETGGLHLAGGGLSSGQFVVDNGAQLYFSDFNEGTAAAGAETTTLDVDSEIDASDGGAVRFTNLFGNSRTDVYGTIDATVLESDPGPLGLVLFHDSASYGATTRGNFTANSGVTTFDVMSAKVVDVIVNGSMAADAEVNLVNAGSFTASGAVNVNEHGVLNVGDGPSAGLVLLDAGSEQQLIGAGEIVLRNANSAIQTTDRIMIDEDLTIRGRGQVQGGNSLAHGHNLGTLTSDTMGGTLRTTFLDNAGSIQGTGGGSVDVQNAINTGTIGVSGGGNLMTTNLDNRKTVTINGGTLTLAGPNWVNSNAAASITATNASISLQGDFTFADVGVINRTNTSLFLQGTLQNTAQTLNLDNSTGARGSWILNSGTLTRIVGGTVQTSGGARLVLRGSAGILQGVTLKSDPLFEDGSSMFVADGLTLDNVTLDLSVGGTGSAGVAFTDNGPRSILGTGQIVLGNVDNRGIDNSFGAQATIGPNIAIRGKTGRLFGGTNGILLQGSISADVPGGFVSLDNVTIAAGGVGEAKNGGTLRMAGNWDNNGTIRVMTGSTLDLLGTFDTPDLGSVIQRTGTTTVQMFGVLTNTSQTFDLHPTTGTLLLRSGAQILGGVVQSTGSSALVVSTDVGASLLSGVTLTTKLSFASGAGGVVNVTNGLTLGAMIDMATGGTSRTVSFSGTTAQLLGGSGEVVMSSGCLLRNGMTAGAVLTIGPLVTVRGEGMIDGNAFGGGGVVNQGQIRVQGTSVSMTVKQGTNAGVMVAQGGNTLGLSGPSAGETMFVQTAGQLRMETTGLITADRSIDIRGGLLGGSGTLQLLGGAAPTSFVRATSGGSIAPGSSIGTLTVDGNVVIGDGGHLAVELSGASTDLLSIVKGQFQTAAGNLDLSSTNDFLDVTKLGSLTATSYLIATYVGSLTGTFDHVTAGYSVTYDTAQKKVFLIAPPRADFDIDGDVDGNDFLIWQRGLGIGAGATRQQGDANGDGAVNAADLALWQTQLGTPAVGASGAVPEPASGWLILAAVGGVALTSRRRSGGHCLSGARDGGACCRVDV
jgi:fibronectin-binding autotransporter adhesin